MQANLLSRTIGCNRNVRSEANAFWDSAWGKDCVSGDGDFDSRLGSKPVSLFAWALRSRLLCLLRLLSALNPGDRSNNGRSWLCGVRRWQCFRHVDYRRDGRCTRGSRLHAPSCREQEKHRHCRGDGHAARNRKHPAREFTSRL
jgi:hypothetical protein